jgi:thiol:disulfide interchange protein
MLYQLAGFGTLNFVVPKPVNWVINIGILCLITASYVANREGEYFWERRFAGILVVAMAITVFYGVLKLRQMQTIYDVHCPPKAPK